MRLKDFLTEKEDLKIQELKLELLDAPNDKVRTLIMVQINEILDNAEDRFNNTNFEKRLPLMNPIKFTIGDNPEVYKLYKLEHEGHYNYVVLVIRDGELKTEFWPIEEVESNINNGIWKEVN